MIKKCILKQESIILLIVSFFSGICITLLNISTDLLDTYNLEQIFVMARELWIEPGQFSSEIFSILIPIILMFVFLANGILDNYEIVKSYIFIRLGSATRWFISQSFVTILLAFVSSLVYHLGLILVCVALGFHSSDLNIMSSLFLYSVFSTTMILYIVSIISISVAFITDIKKAVMLSVCFLVTSMILSTMLPAKITKWFWASHYFAYWHDPGEKIVFLLNGNFLYDNGITTSFMFSIVFMLSFILIENLITCFILNRIDYV